MDSDAMVVFSSTRCCIIKSQNYYLLLLQKNIARAGLLRSNPSGCCLNWFMIRAWFLQSFLICRICILTRRLYWMPLKRKKMDCGSGPRRLRTSTCFTFDLVNTVVTRDHAEGSTITIKQRVTTLSSSKYGSTPVFRWSSGGMPISQPFFWLLFNRCWFTVSISEAHSCLNQVGGVH